MSSRQLKKLHKQQELLRLQNLAADEGASSEEEVAPSKPKASAFAGFAALEGDDDNDDEPQDQEQDEEEEVEAEPAESVPKPTKKPKKSKKKKKAKKEAAAVVPDAKTKDDEMDEIDQALSELNMKPKSQASAEQDAPSNYDAKLARLLSISFDHLKVINELRAMFGQETIDSVRNQDEAQGRDDRRRNRRGGPHQMQIDMETFLKGRPGEKISEVVLRKNPFVQGKGDWPRASAGGLKMAAVTDERVEPTEYTFSHDKGYEMLEMQFFSLVDMMDPMRIVHFVQQNPYHVNALVQTSRVAKNDHNAALAGDLCERALFTFGRVTLSSFRKKLERGLARLDFRRPENRQFWLAGYHYIKSLMQKGTYDTALEWTKLFLSLSPKDEYAMMNFTHVLAIHAYEAKWLIALCESAYFTSDEYDLPMKEYHRQTCVLAKLQLGDKEGALKDLVKGMETLPWLYSAICSAVNIDTPRAIWGVQPRDDDDTLYTELYIHMAKDIWKRDGTDLLKEAGERATKVDVRSLPPAQEVPLSIGRFIYLDNTPELMGLVPPSMLHASPNFDYDPLPPPREENIFSNEFQSIPWRRREDRPVGPAGMGRGQMDDLLQVARGLMRPRRRGEVGLDDPDRMPQGVGAFIEDDDYDEEEMDEEEQLAAVAAAAQEGGEGGFLSTLARMLLPLWGRQAPNDAPDHQVLDAVLGRNPWDEEDEREGEDDDGEMPDFVPVGAEGEEGGATEGGNAPTRPREGGDEDPDGDMPALEPVN